MNKKIAKQLRCDANLRTSVAVWREQNTLQQNTLQQLIRQT